MTQPAAATPDHALPAGPIPLVARWALPLTALLVAGPAVSWPLRHLRGPDGGPDTTLLLSNAPLRGLLFLLLASVVALVLGRLAAAVLNRAIALGIAGYCLLWAAWMTGGMDDLYRVWPAGVGTTLRLAAEAVIVGALCLALARVILRSGDDRPGGPSTGTRASLPGLAAPVCAAAVAAGAVAWAIARDDHRGQCLFAAFLAGIAAGVVARLVQVQTHPDRHDAPARPAMMLAIAGCTLAGVLAPLVAIFMPGLSDLPAAATAHRLAGILRLQALDWAAGALLGVPIGLSWAAGVLPQPDARRA